MSIWINRPTREWHLEGVRSTGSMVGAACGATWQTSMIDPRRRIDDTTRTSIAIRCKACDAISSSRHD